LSMLALGDVAHQRNREPLALLPERTNAHLDGKHASILAAVVRLEGDHFTVVEPRTKSFQEFARDVGVELVRRHADQFVARIAKTHASLLVGVQNATTWLVDEERVH